MVKNSLWKKINYFFHPKDSADEVIFSPNKKIVCHFLLKHGHIFYSVSKNGDRIVSDSKLSIVLKGGNSFIKDFSIIRVTEKSVDDTWETVWGEEKNIRNNYNEKVFYLAEKSNTNKILTIKFRIFNDGVAFRYEIPPQPSFSRIIIDEEKTEFNVDNSGFAWKIPAYQPDRYEYNYEKTPVFELKSSVHTPLTIETPNNYFLSIHEAALYNYGSMTLKLNDWNALCSDITPLSNGSKAYVDLPFSTPWRVIMIADSAVELIKNHMILNLNEPPRDDFSWVKPLKFMGIWWAMFVGEWTWAPGERHGATTEHMFEYIKSCKRLGIDGLLAEGWNNGWEGDWLQNGAYTDFTHPMPDFDIEKISTFAKENQIELVGHHETVGFVDNYEKQLEKSYAYYKNYGFNYIKTGYSGSMMTIQGKKEWHHSQLGVNHYQKTVELAAKYHICLDIHEPIKGTGIERTFPNLLAREGARGQEYEGGALTPNHLTILPFTRLLASGMDYTSGIFDISNSTKRIASTLARQLALFVVIPSGMEMAADRPEFYEEKYPEVFKFIHDVPVNWYTSLPLLGEIGEYYVVARKDRNSEDWFLGGVSNEKAQNVEFSLDFLGEGNFVAEIYRDTFESHYRDNPLAIEIKEKNVNSKTKIRIFMAAGGGFAIKIRKK